MVVIVDHPQRHDRGCRRRTYTKVKMSILFRHDPIPKYTGSFPLLILAFSNRSIGREANLFRIVAITALLLGISPFGVAQVTGATSAPSTLGKMENRNVTSIVKNQIYPLKVELMRDPCATALCYSI
jgi:hypothetical protein